jgi:thiol-disulfide isomerase/thioredoxin
MPSNRFILTLAVVVCVVLRLSSSVSAADPAPAPGSVISLSPANISQADKGFWFIKFFSPTCPHCVEMAPAWVELAKKVSADIKIGEVDCTKHRDLCHKFNVHSYPTLIAKSNGRTRNYNGPRTVPELLKFLTVEKNRK